MKIQYLKEVQSTHTYLKELIQMQGFRQPLCIATHYQTNGIGSRGNDWIGKEGNLFFSFVLEKKSLPHDLKLQSASIYFSYLLVLVLKQKGSQLWLKWPNDFYIEQKKIGGTITNVNSKLLFCGIGLNLQKVNETYGYLDIKINTNEVLTLYFELLHKKISWKDIFREFQIEFQKSRFFKSSVKGEKISLKSAILNDDGSIDLGNKKVFSLR
jgi:BirA family biotin operon repressor/biotin-[acetyl-CoA-carboxylase] ligase